MGAINCHREGIIRGTYGLFTKSDREKGKEDFGRDLETVGGRERSEGGRYAGGEDVYRQDTRNSGSVGGPPAHILSLRAT